MEKEMKSYFMKDHIIYIVYENSNFDDVDVVVKKIGERYDVVVMDKVEVFDSYWLLVNINKEYTIRIRHHDITGLIISSINKKSNTITTEIVQYLEQLIFHTKKTAENEKNNHEEKISNFFKKEKFFKK